MPPWEKGELCCFLQGEVISKVASGALAKQIHLTIFRWNIKLIKMVLKKRVLREHGFSLIELIIVIAIVAILIVLLMSTFDRYADIGIRSKCLNNLKTLQQAATLWSADHDGRIFPSVWNIGGDEYEQKYFIGWQFLLTGWSLESPSYLDNISILHCPGYDKKYKPLKTTRYAGYGRSYFLSGSSGTADFSGRFFDGEGRLTQISNPTKTVSFYDMNNLSPVGDAYGGAPVDGGTSYFYQFHPIHSGGFNLVFFDGHAEWVKFNTSAQYGGYYANAYPQFIWKPY